MNKSVQKLLILSIVALLLSACGSFGPSLSQQRAESLLGEWSFSHPGVSPSSQSYSFTEVEKSADFPDGYVVFGLSGGDVGAVAMYDPRSTIAEKYAVVEFGQSVDHVYLFKFDLGNSVSGMYGQLDATTGEVVRTVDFTGARSSLNTQSLSVQHVSELSTARVLEAYRSVRAK